MEVGGTNTDLVMHVTTKRALSSRRALWVVTSPCESVVMVTAAATVSMRHWRLSA